ncbi:hypothetical protein ES708_33599 [subsurface metagenome]
MSSKCNYLPPHRLTDDSFLDVLSLVEERAKNKDVDSPFLSRDIDHLLAAEAIRQLQTLVFESSRIADSLNSISTEMRNMLKQELNDLIYTNRDMVGTLSMILVKLLDPDEE